MEIEIARFADLSPADLVAWQELRSADPRLDSPHLHPSFSSAVDTIWHDVSVAVIHDRGGVPTYLLPFQSSRRVLRPVGWPAADIQAPIAAPAAGPVDPLDVVRAAGARVFVFDHLLADTPAFAPWITARHESPYVDVAGGLEAYLARASSGGRRYMKRAHQRLGQLAEQVGTVHFDADSRDPALLDEVLALKRRQYVATGARDYFATPGRTDFLHHLLGQRDPSFSGVLSVLHAGDRFVTAHFGVRSERVLHWWFPVYDPDLSEFGPGWLLLRQLVEASPALGIERIDLGRGESQYKRHLKTGEVFVGEGRVERGWLAPAARRAARRVAVATKDNRLGSIAARAAKDVRTWQRSLRSDVNR